MKQVIRNCVFETNSSSEHVLSHTCQVGRVPGWEFFFGKVSPLDKEIQFNYSEFEGIWTFSDKFLALCQSYYPFYQDCFYNKHEPDVGLRPRCRGWGFTHCLDGNINTLSLTA